MDYRVTNSMMFDRLKREVQANRQEMTKIQESISTGKNINRPSDDPALYKNITDIKTQIASFGQYKENCEFGEDWLNYSYTATEHSFDLISSAKDIAYKVANDTATVGEREMSAKLIQDIREDIVNVVNTRLNGRYIFGGENGNNKPAIYTDGTGEELSYINPDGRWSNNQFIDNTGAEVPYINPNGTFSNQWQNAGVFEIGISKNNEMNIGTSMSLFMEVDVSDATSAATTKSIFDILGNLEKVLNENDGDEIRKSLQELDAVLDNISQEQSNIGAKIERLTSHRDFIENMEKELDVQRSTKEDVDFIEKAVELSGYEENYQAIITSFAKFLNQNLFDLFG